MLQHCGDVYILDDAQWSQDVGAELRQSCTLMRSRIVSYMCRRCVKNNADKLDELPDLLNLQSMLEAEQRLDCKI